MVKINDFFVGFNKQFSVYSPGDIVTGNVALDFGEKIFADQVVGQFYGSARVFWTERELKPPNGTQTITYSQEKVYFDEKKVLWGAENPTSNEKNLEHVLAKSSSGLRLKNTITDDSNRPSLPKGEHKLAFEFRLPEFGLPTSYDAKHSVGCVRYYVKVAIMEWGQVKHSRKSFFTVVRPLDLNTIPRAIGAASKTGERAVGRMSVLGCMGGSGDASKGRVSALLTLQQCGYVPGEPLRASVEVDNKTDRAIKYVQARLVQHTTSYADKPEFKMAAASSVVVSTGMQQKKIGRRQAILFEPLLYVPAVVPTFNIDSCLEVGYTVRVDVAFERKHPMTIVSLELPVVVGTVPLRPISHEQQQLVQRHLPPPVYSKEEEEQQQPTAPLIDIPPPSYVESITGSSPFQPSQDNYAPHYPVFNFGGQQLLTTATNDTSLL